MNQIIHALAFERDMEIRREIERKTQYGGDWSESQPVREPRKPIINRVFNWALHRTNTETRCEGVC